VGNGKHVLFSSLLESGQAGRLLGFSRTEKMGANGKSKGSIRSQKTRWAFEVRIEERAWGYL